MTRIPISSDLVGLELPATTQAWTSKDTMLYALGVGGRPAEDLDFIYEGRGPKVLPTYAVIPGGGALGGLMRTVDMRLENRLFVQLTPEAAKAREASVKERAKQAKKSGRDI